MSIISKIRVSLNNCKVDFMSIHKIALVLSIVFMIGSLILVFTKGLNYGIDFAGGVLIEATANQSSNFRRVANTTGTFIAKARAVFEPAAGPPSSYRLGVRGNYTSIFAVGVYALDGVTNITASTSVTNIVLSIDGIYWND